ncbi:MAG: DJ-1/PfpI family protein, partial [Gammaproteobacteria bacterium]
MKAFGNNSHFLRLERTFKRLEAELLEHKRRSVRCARSHPDKTSCAQIATCLLPDTTLDEALLRDYDMVVLPGGTKGAGRLEADARVSALVTRVAEDGRYTAAICAAPRYWP